MSKFAVVLAFYISLSERDILKQLVFLVLLYGFGELLDELFFDPSKMQLNEVIIILVALFYVIYGRKTLSIKWVYDVVIQDLALDNYYYGRYCR